MNERINQIAEMEVMEHIDAEIGRGKYCNEHDACDTENGFCKIVFLEIPQKHREPSKKYLNLSVAPAPALKRAKEALFESEEMPRMLLGHSPGMIFRQSERGSYLRKFQRGTNARNFIVIVPCIGGGKK